MLFQVINQVIRVDPRLHLNEKHYKKFLRKEKNSNLILEIMQTQIFLIMKKTTTLRKKYSLKTKSDYFF